MELPYQVKDYFKDQGIITDVDPQTGTIKGYFAIFGNIDSDKDMLMPGAFTKTLQEQGGRVRHVWQHDITKPLSRPILEQDSKGLAFTSTISPTTWGKNVIQLYNDKVVDEHSFGYNVVKQQKMAGYNELREVRLWEGSTVTLGANSLSLGGPAKSLTKEQLIDRIDRVYKALRNGKYEGDEIFEVLDVYHQQLKQLFYDLANTPAAESSAPEPEEKNENGEQIKEKVNSLISLFK